MESALPLFARLLNETGHSLDFSVEEGRCPIPSLGPDGRGLVNLSEIHNLCSRKSSSWLITVSIDKKLTEMTLAAGKFLKHAQILFRFEENENGKIIFIAEGIEDENIGLTLRLSWNIGFVMGMNDICSGRTYSPIADVLLEFPLNMQQTRQKDRKAGKASKFQQREAKGSLKKRVRNMCSDVAVVPEVLVNPNKRLPLREKDGKAGKAPKSQQREAKDSLKKRKEESPQTEVDNSVKHIKVNPPKSMCSDVTVVHEAIVNSNKRSPLIRKEESPQTEVDNSLKHIKVNPPKSDVAVVHEAVVNSNKRSPLIRKEGSPQTEIDNSVKHIKVNPPKRENGGIAWKAPKSQQRESNDSLKKSMCSDVTVVHEAIVNSNKRSPLIRKEGSRQTEVDNSVKHIKVNPPKRENGGIAWKAPKSQQRESNDSLKKSDVAVVHEAIVNSNKRSPLRFSNKMNITKEESPQSEIDDFVKCVKMNPSKRKTTATYTPLDGSRHDTFETKMSNSSQMEPLQREGNSTDFCCHHHYHYQQQQLTEHLEYEHDHPPHSFHVPNKDITDRMFMLLCAILGVGLVHMLLLGF